MLLRRSFVDALTATETFFFGKRGCLSKGIGASAGIPEQPALDANLALFASRLLILFAPADTTARSELHNFVTARKFHRPRFLVT